MMRSFALFVVISTAIFHLACGGGGIHSVGSTYEVGPRGNATGGGSDVLVVNSDGNTIGGGGGSIIHINSSYKVGSRGSASGGGSSGAVDNGHRNGGGTPVETVEGSYKRQFGTCPGSNISITNSNRNLDGRSGIKSCCWTMVYSYDHDEYFTGTTIYSYGDRKSGSIVFDDGCGVFNTPCNADHIKITWEEGDFAKIYPNKSFDILNFTDWKMKGMEVKGDKCSAKATHMFGPDCERKIIEINGHGDSVQIDFPSGIFDTNGQRFRAKAVCKDHPSVVDCQDLNCDFTETPVVPINGPTNEWGDNCESYSIFDSSCNAEEIEMTGEGGTFFTYDRNGQTVPTKGYHVFGMEIIEVAPKIIRHSLRIDDGSDVTIDFANGNITTTKTAITARAICKGHSSAVFFRDGQCKQGSIVPSTPTHNLVIKIKDESGIAVFHSTCNADEIEVTNDEGYLAMIYSNRSIEEFNFTNDMEFGLKRTCWGGNCSKKSIEITSESLDKLTNPVNTISSVKIDFPNGIITTSGTGFIVKAVCKDQQSRVDCRAGKCTCNGTSCKAPEENEGGTPVETDQEGSDDVTSGPIDPVKPAEPSDSVEPQNPIEPTVIDDTGKEEITDKDDRPESNSDPKKAKDSANGNSKSDKSTKPEEEKTSTLLIVSCIVGGLVAFGLVAALIFCVLKKRSSNSEAKDVEDGTSKTTNEIAGDAPSDQ